MEGVGEGRPGMSSATGWKTPGKRVYYGDASRPDYLRRCGLETARAVVVTMDSPTLVARARDAAHARALHGLGVNDAVPETIEASLQLSEAVLVDLGVPMASSSPPSTRSATNTARSWSPPAHRSGPARRARPGAREPERVCTPTRSLRHDPRFQSTILPGQ
jgi:hypothetical protein